MFNDHQVPFDWSELGASVREATLSAVAEHFSQIGQDRFPESTDAGEEHENAPALTGAGRDRLTDGDAA